MRRRAAGNVGKILGSRTKHGIADLVDEVVEVREVDVTQIAPNPQQPRRHFSAVELKQLASSIETHGLLQPIVVRQSSDGYELIAGSRRLRAVESLGRPRITAIILQEGDSAVLALIENLQRADLDPLDEAEALAALKELRGHTLEGLQKIVGRSVSYLSEIMSLQKLPENILAEARALAAEGRPVPRASLIELARMKDEQRQRETWQRLLAGETRRSDVRMARARSASSGRTDAGESVPALARKISRLGDLIGRTMRSDSWRDPSIRERLRQLRSQIDGILSEN